jgi:hypothetical protein
MIKILAVLLLSLAGFYLGYKLYKSNKENNPTLSLYATLTMICAISGGIVLTSFLMLKGDHWTGENKALLRYILVCCLTVSFLFLAAKLIIRGRKGDDRLAQIAGLSWVFVTLLASGYALSYVSKMNEGWTSERQKLLTEQCVKYNDTGSSYDCPCYTQAVMKKYKTNDAYTAAMTTDAGVLFNAEMDEDCACGSKSYSDSEVESIDF